MKNVNMNTVAETIAENAKNVGTREALVQYLSQIAANLPDNKFPNGYTPQQAGDEIWNTTVTYTGAYNAKITKDELREMIAQQCQYMTSEQAAEYLAGIHVFYNNLGNPAAKSEQLAEEIRSMAAAGDGVSVEEHIEELVDRLDPQTMPSVFGFVHQVEENMNENGETAVDATLVSDRLSQHLDTEQRAIYAAVEYGEVVQGNVQNVDPGINPSMVAAGTCAAADAAKIAMDEQSGAITVEEAGEQLNLVERAFMAALAGLWGAAYMAIGVVGADTIAVLLQGIGVPYVVTFWIAMLLVLMFAEDLEDEVKLAYSNVTAAYCWLKKRTRPFRTKVGGYVNSAVRSARNYFGNPARA